MKNISYIRQLSQQLAMPQFSTPYEVVDWMGMLQAQDYVSVPWAVGVRMKRPSMKQFLADFNAARIVRTHLFRNTVQLVTVEDLPWMQMLYAERGLKVELTFSRLHGLENERLIALISEKTSDILSQRAYIDKETLVGILNEQYGIPINKDIVHCLLRVLEYKGIVCSGPMEGRFSTYRLQSEVVKTPCRLSKEEATILLARKYFRSHSPASLDDFVWWSALPKGQCDSAIAAIAQEMEAINVDGQLFYLHQDARTGRLGQTTTQLLPAYDEYLISYKSRHFVLNPTYRSLAHNNFGLFWPVILHKGQIVGNWNKKLEFTWFEEAMQTDLTKAVDRYKGFLAG